MSNVSFSELFDLISELKMCLSEQRESSFNLASSRYFWNVGNSWVKNNRNFEDKGDFVVSLTHLKCHAESSDQKKLTSSAPMKKMAETSSNEQRCDSVVESIVVESESWPIRIKKCRLKDDKLMVNLDRASAFKVVLGAIISEGIHYGSRSCEKQPVCLSSDEVSENSDLTEMRLNLAKEVLNRTLCKIGFNVIDKETPNCLRVHLTLNPSMKNPNVHTLACGVVRNSSSHKKEVSISSSRYFRMREKDMEESSVHKYGSSALEPSWKGFIKSIANSAVTVDLLSTRISQPVSLDLQDKFVLNREKSNKGAQFLLYNYARLLSILKQFDEKVNQDVYPPLVPIDDINFSLLSLEEEWVLLFNFLLPYPSLLSQLVDPIGMKFDIHVLIQFMQDLCKYLSAYYSRVHILTEPRKHLLPLMYARLHLITAVKIVMLSIFTLFNIVPVSQM